MEITLTQGKVALVDDADGPLVTQHKWFALHDKGNDAWYAGTKINGKLVRLHTFLTGFQRTDHWDRNGLNNSRSNLRACTSIQNGQNRRKHRNARSLLKGAFWHKRRGKWCANIRVNKQLIYLGYFDTEDAAHAAYCVAAKTYFGDFARF